MAFLRFTERARNGLRLYNLTAADAIGAVRQGKLVAADQPGKFHAWRRKNDRWLRVTFIDDSRGGKIVGVSMLAAGPPDE